jgi:hypothetical protein
MVLVLIDYKHGQGYENTNKMVRICVMSIMEINKGLGLRRLL